jgi:hypothetical protein
MGEQCSRHKIKDKFTQTVGKLRIGDQLGDLGVDGKRMLKRILK